MLVFGIHAPMPVGTMFNFKILSSQTCVANSNIKLPQIASHYTKRSWDEQGCATISFFSLFMDGLEIIHSTLEFKMIRLQCSRFLMAAHLVTIWHSI